MRIVFATHAYTPAIGGAERYAQGLAEAFVDVGHDVTVLTPNRSSAESFYEYGHAPAGAPEDTIGGVRVRRLTLDLPRQRWKRIPRDGPIPPETARAMWKEYRQRLESALDRLAPDATIALPHSFPNVSAALSAPSRGIGVYAPLLHEADPAWRIEPIAEIVAKSDVVLAMTDWERDRLVGAYGSTLDQTHIAPPTIDAPQPDTVAPYEFETPYVVSIGRRTHSKELLTSARAIRRMNSQERRIRLVIAGPGSAPDLDRELRSLDASIELLGEVTDNVKWSLIKGSLASVSMSAAESFGIGIVETWTMGRPPIARRIGPTESIVEDGVDGYLVDSEDELVDRLTTLLANPSLATRMGFAGHRKSLSASSSTASTVLSAITTALDTGYNRRGNGGNAFDES